LLSTFTYLSTHYNCTWPESEGISEQQKHVASDITAVNGPSSRAKMIF